MADRDLYGTLKKYAASDFYPFHMPGHKRGGLCRMDAAGIDITEIDGFDDLNHPSPGGILAEAQKKAAALFGAEETHFLVNGSTAGILSAVCGCARPGGSILIARNCHKSVYNAAELGRLSPCYVYPGWISDDGINGPVYPADIRALLEEKPSICAVVVTSPTYDGVCSDIQAIADVCHASGIPLIVDQAHGAHFHFSGYFPKDAVSAGADVVIHSLHKTLPSLTQTGLLHIQGSIADRGRIWHYLTVFQSSSPSYVLMASIDSCIRMLSADHDLFPSFISRLECFRERCGKMDGLRLLDADSLPKEAAGEKTDFDRSRLVISTRGTGITGRRLYDTLREDYHIQMEMAAPGYALGISTVADTARGFDRLAGALYEIDDAAGRDVLKEAEDALPNGGRSVSENALNAADQGSLERLETVLCPWEVSQRKDLIYQADLDDARGRVSAGYIYLYPPGIPAVVPGERISSRTVERLKRLMAEGYDVQGVKNGKTLLYNREEQRG